MLFPPEQVERANKAQKEYHERAIDSNRCAFWNALGDIWTPPIQFAFYLLEKGDIGMVDVAIRFLEEDPVFFGSGYKKESTIRLLNRHELSEPYRLRLRDVCLKAVDTCGRREFRSFTRLAAHVGDDHLVVELLERLSAPGPVRSRAVAMLKAMSQAKSMREVRWRPIESVVNGERRGENSPHPHNS